MRRTFPFLFVVACAFSPDVRAGQDPWPEFHGAHRDNLSREKGLLQAWPEGGPKQIWVNPECGTGYAGVSVGGGLIFTSGDFGAEERVLALREDGTILWQKSNGASWTGATPGARTTPTLRDGAVYHMNPTGRLASFDAETGHERWAVDLKERFGATHGIWAMSENVLLEGDLLMVTPGGAKGRIAALERETGKTFWANTDVPDGAAYCSPILLTHKGVRQFVTVMQKTVVSVDVATGKLLWTHPHTTKADQNVTPPVYRDGLLFVSSGHGTGGRLLKLDDDSRGVGEVWLSSDLDNCHGGVLLLEDALYGSGCRQQRKGLVCIDFKTGETLWNQQDLGKLSMTHADGRFYGISDRGRVSLLAADREGCRVAGRFDLPRVNGRLTLAHPVVAGGRLYLRSWSNLYVFDVRAGAKPWE